MTAQRDVALHQVKRGYDLPLAGEPRQEVDDGPVVTRVAMLGVDFPGLKPRVEVEADEAVRRGQTLVTDRSQPAIRHTSPGSGRIVGVYRGERRRLLSVVVELEKSELHGEGPQVDLPTVGSEASPEALEDVLLRSGLWTSLRTRPFGVTPRPGTVPRSIFVTALDTQPHAPDIDVALEGLEAYFEAGLSALVTLARGGGQPLRLCLAERSRLAALAPSGAEVHCFSGPHPAGLAGLHMSLVDPVGRGRQSWYLGAQDVVAIGQLVLEGTLRVERVVAVGGPLAARPRLLRTRLGASVTELLAGEVQGTGRYRLVSGSVLHGQDATEGELAYLGRFHQQVSILSDDRKRKFFGWMAPRLIDTLLLDPWLSKLFPKARLALDTLQNGEPRPLVPIGRYERYMPYPDIVPPLLFRALLTGDLDKAEALGALELEEEDLALCSFACPSKLDFGRHLRHVLRQLEKEWA